MKKYIVNLTDDERKTLKGIISSGKHTARKIRRARILLKADAGAGCTDKKIAIALDVSICTIEQIRKRFVEYSFKDVVNGRKPNRKQIHKIDGKREAQLITLACSEAPEGSSRWTLRMLADKMVQLDYVDNVSHETIRKTLKKTS